MYEAFTLYSIKFSIVIKLQLPISYHHYYYYYYYLGHYFYHLFLLLGLLVSVRQLKHELKYKKSNHLQSSYFVTTHSLLNLHQMLKSFYLGNIFPTFCNFFFFLCFLIFSKNIIFCIIDAVKLLNVF